jgi:hypothetical protein
MTQLLKTIPVVMLLLAGIATAGTMSVRLVECSNGGGGIDGGLADIGTILETLPFTQYSQLDATAVDLPAANIAVTLAGYEMNCNGGQKSLSIALFHGGRPLLTTTASLKPGKPLILGGFPTADGSKIMLVLTLSESAE